MKGFRIGVKGLVKNNTWGWRWRERSAVESIPSTHSSIISSSSSRASDARGVLNTDKMRTHVKSVNLRKQWTLRTETVSEL